MLGNKNSSYVAPSQTKEFQFCHFTFFFKDLNVLSDFEDKVAIRWHRELAGEYVPLVHMFCDSDFVDINAVGEDQKPLSGIKYASCCLARAVHKSRETKNRRDLWFLTEWCIFAFPIYWKTFTFAVVLHNESSSWSFRITAQKAGLRPMMRLSPWRVIALEITWNNFSGWGGWVGNWTPGAEFFFG